jgi:predicted transposase YbfD/YdcC
MAGAGFYPQGHPNVEIAYCMLSTAMSAEGFNTVVRSHREIESHLHWRPEVIMNEDQDRNRMEKGFITSRSCVTWCHDPERR